MMKILVTGGAGFIGSNFINYLLEKYKDARIINYDKLTYAGNPDNLRDMENDPRYKFVKGDICDEKKVGKIVSGGVDRIVNFAAESHVDKSITDPGAFVRTNVYGTQVLLEAARKHKVERFLFISTDEIYGSREKGSFRESDAFSPSSPYSASKAGADLLALAYHRTFGLPVVVTRSSNNFGPYQYPEKLIPRFITNAMRGVALPLYGDGLAVRDWLYVKDNCEALDLVLEKGKEGEAYNVGAGNEHTNKEITGIILEALEKPESLIKYVADRPGHDRRYSISTEKVAALGWKPRHEFRGAMLKTINWYVQNEWWWKKLI